VYIEDFIIRKKVITVVESVIPAVVKIMKDLRRPGEKVGIFYSPDENDKINGKIVEYEIPIISMVYPGVIEIRPMF
jgi:hypothetical protein